MKVTLLLIAGFLFAAIAIPSASATICVYTVCDSTFGNRIIVNVVAPNSEGTCSNTGVFVVPNPNVLGATGVMNRECDDPDESCLDIWIAGTQLGC